MNDAAGSVARSEAEQEAAAIEAAFAAAGAEARVHLASPADYATLIPRLWSAAPTPTAVVVAGGDGTVNCAAQAAVDTEVVLGVLPMGTFNHFAKDLGLPTELAEAVAALVAGSVQAVDVAEVNGRVFVNNSVLGAYPTMVAVRDRLREQRGWGKVRAVPVAAWRVLRALPVHRFDLVGPGFVRHRVRTPLLFVGNGVYDNEGGGVLAREALGDGELGVAVVQVSSRFGLVRTVLRSLVAGVERARDVDLAAVSELLVSGRFRHVRVAVDGEVCWLDVPLRYRVRPGALRVLAPTPA